MRSEPQETSHLEVSVGENGRDFKYAAVAEVITRKEPGQFRDRIARVEAPTPSEALRKIADELEGNNEIDEQEYADTWREYGDEIEE